MQLELFANIEKQEKEMCKPEEWQLIKAVQAGNSEAHEKLIKQYNNFVRSIVGSFARKYNMWNIEEDLVQEAYIALLTAARKYDPYKGASFCTYAYQWIQQALQRYMVQKGSIVHRPQWLWETFTQILHYKEEHSNATVEEIANALGKSVDTIEKTLYVFHATISTDEEIYERGGATIEDMLQYETTEDMLQYKDTESVEENSIIDILQDTLSDEEIDILFALSGVNCKQITPLQLAKKYHTTEEEIKRTYQDIIDKVRPLLRPMVSISL